MGGGCANQCTLGSSQCAGPSVQVCEMSASGCAVSSTKSCGVFPSWCARNAGPACADVNWTQWPAPNGAPDTTAPNQVTHTDNQNGTVSDSVTKLIWQKGYSPTTLSWQAAVDYCTGLRVGGFADWRLPAEIELLSIVNHAAVDPALDAVFDAPSQQAKEYGFWSQTVRASDNSRAWYVNFSQGWTTTNDSTEDTTHAKTNAYWARCVR